MSMAEELERLQGLHRGGTLSDQELAQAKQAVLDGQPAAGTAPAVPGERPGSLMRIPWVGLFLVGFLVAAYASNPSRPALEKTYKEQLERRVADEGWLKRNTIKAVGKLSVSYSRQDYGLFSVGLVTVHVPFLSGTQRAYYVGAFGRWWLEMPLGAGVVEK